MTSKEKQLEQYIDPLGLRHFKGREFTPYWSRTKNGAKNSIPHESLWPNIAQTLIVADEVRHKLAAPMKVTSSYRNPAYNRAVGGAPASLHLRFNALDLSCADPGKAAAIADSLRGKLFGSPTSGGGTFTFAGGIGTYSTFVHIDTRGYDADW